MSEGSEIVPNKVIQILLVAAATIGLIEGLTWIILSIVSVAYYARWILPRKGAQYFQYHVDRTLYDFYLNNRYENVLKETMKDFPLPLTATPFFVCTVIYLIISALLFLNSIFIFWKIYQKNQQYFKEIIGCWTIVLGLNSLVDLILLCLIAMNYHQINKYQLTHGSGPSANDAVVLASTGILMTLAIRGYILWIINIVLTGLMGKLCHSYFKKVPFFGYTSFETRQSNLPWETHSPARVSNDSFTSNSHVRVAVPFSKLRPLDFQPNPRTQMTRALNMDIIDNGQSNQFGNPKVPPKPYPKPTTTGMVYGEDPPIDMPPPFIPRPDYTPPNSPINGRAVRQRQEYLL